MVMPSSFTTAITLSRVTRRRSLVLNVPYSGSKAKRTKRTRFCLPLYRRLGLVVAASGPCEPTLQLLLQLLLLLLLLLYVGSDRLNVPCVL